MSSPGDAVWSEEGTTPDAIAAALRDLLAERARAERQAQGGGLVPARVLNMVVFVESRYAEQIASRLRGVGRYHASRTVMLSYEPDRERLSARISLNADGEHGPDQVEHGPDQMRLLRETAIVEIGERHLDDLATIADPLVISDLPTLLWSPHGYSEATDALLGLAQSTLIDSVEELDWGRAIGRACTLSEQVYVVDLAWLRSTPWRERVAATFDPPRMRAELDRLSALTIRHHPASTVAAMLFAGWLASRLHWRLGRLHSEDHADRDRVLIGAAQTDSGEVALRLRAAPDLQVPGLAGIELESRSGLWLSLDRGPGGLHERRSLPAAGARHETAVGARQSDSERAGHDGGATATERAWTLLGASRGEGGILGEGIRQALLRDPTYLPALHAADTMLPEAAGAGTAESAQRLDTTGGAPA